MRTPRYRRHTLRDFAFVEVNGQRVRLPGSYNSPESRAAYSALLKERGINGDKLSLTVKRRRAVSVIGDLVVAYLDHARERYPGPRGEYDNVKHSLNRALPLLGDERVDSFGPLKVKALQAELVRQDYARKEVNATIGRFRRMLRWGVSEELVPETILRACNTVDGLRKGQMAAREGEPVVPVPLEVVAATLPHCNRIVRAMVTIQRHTGIRSKSLCQARPSQFDLGDEDWIWSPRHKQEYRDQALSVPLGPEAKAAIEPFLERDPTTYLFRPREVRNNPKYNERYTTGTYRQAIARACARAGVDEWTPHRLRHTWATEVRARFGVEAAQVSLGHASLDATIIYAQSSLALARRVARAMG